MLDLALSRGGDQVAIKIASDDKFLFYGGKTNPVEKRNRVRARVNAQAYERLVRDSERVIIWDIVIRMWMRLEPVSDYYEWELLQRKKLTLF